jgi:hypothetical protein
LYYLNSRFYDAKIARFLSEDTYRGKARDPLSLNLYSYVSNNPITYSDPTGHHQSGEVLSASQTYNADVAEMQNKLIKLGYMAAVPQNQIGYFGTKTQTAVDAFKKDNSLTNNTISTKGKVGDTTWAYLDNAYDKSVAITNAALSGNYSSISNIITQSDADLEKKKQELGLNKSTTIFDPVTIVFNPFIPIVPGSYVTTNEYNLIIRIPSSRFPETAQHIQDSIANGQPDILTIDRGNASANRTQSLKGFDTVSGLDRDEYPPAMFKEGGKGADVKPINPSDNRGCGSYVSQQLKKYPNGTKVKIEVVDEVKDDDDNDNNNTPGGSGGNGEEMNSQGIVGVRPGCTVDDGGTIYDENNNQIGYYDYNNGTVYNYGSRYNFVMPYDIPSGALPSGGIVPSGSTLPSWGVRAIPAY